MPSLLPPPDPGLPFFVYGLLKPGELAHAQIEGYILESHEGVVGGCIRLRDGIPLFDPNGRGEVTGFLLRFNPARSMDAWQAVSGFEPGHHYRYGTATVDAVGQQVKANVLVGLRLTRGIAAETASNWSAASDPAFVEGLAEVFKLTVETAPEGVRSQPDGESFWSVFFRLQAAYLLLWSIVERYSALRFGPALQPNERVKMLGREPAFTDAVVASGAVGCSVVDSRDPEERFVIGADGERAHKFFYQVRSNLSHRGKSAFRDGQLVLGALVRLHDVMREVLADQAPALVEEWRKREMGGWILQDRIPLQ